MKHLNKSLYISFGDSNIIHICNKGINIIFNKKWNNDKLGSSKINYAIRNFCFVTGKYMNY